MSQKQATDPVGEGTPGARVKAAWRRAGGGAPLKAWARSLAVEIGDGDDGLRADANEWLASKRHGGTDARRQERKLRLRERRSANATARIARRASAAGKQQQKKRGGDDSR